MIPPAGRRVRSLRARLSLCKYRYSGLAPRRGQAARVRSPSADRQTYHRIDVSVMVKTPADATTREKTQETEFEDLKRRIHGKLVDKLDLTRVGDLEGRRAAPRDPPGRRAPVRHRRHAAQPQRARAPDRRSARRDLRPRPARDAAQGSDDQRYPDQRPEEHLRRTPRQDGEDHGHVPRQRPPDADHRPHRLARSAAASTKSARWSTPACQTAPA